MCFFAKHTVIAFKITIAALTLNLPTFSVIIEIRKYVEINNTVVIIIRYLIQ